MTKFITALLMTTVGITSALAQTAATAPAVPTFITTTSGNFASVQFP